jgi:hypothetical protein
MRLNTLKKADLEEKFLLLYSANNKGHWTFYASFIKQKWIAVVYCTMVRLRKLVLVSVLLSVTLMAMAPSRESLVIFQSTPVQPYKRLIHAIGIVETKCDTLSYNPVEKATGYFQIRPVRLEDYNKRTGSHLKMKDLFNYKISEKIFLYYARKIGPYDPEKIARSWNGSGHKTAYYWDRVKRYL